VKRLGFFSAAAGGLLAAAAVAASSSPALAHHSFAGEFDINRPISVDGVVKRMEFTNPHSWLYVDVTTDAGEVQEWAFEGGAGVALVRRGYNRNSIQPGTKVHIEGYQARDGSFKASGRTVTLEDGTEMFVGSVGEGAPSP
jgi:hypothetical protein